MRPPLAIRQACLVVTLAVGLTPLSPLQAQTNIADPEAYRKAKQAATETFLDRAKPKAERLQAAEHLGYPDEATFPRLLAVGIDRREDDAIRWAALQRHRYDPKYVDAVLKILGDPRDGGEDLDALLLNDLSRRTTFRQPVEIRQRIESVFRKLLDDKRDRVRLYAYRALVANHDPVAVNRIADSLRRGRDFPVPLHDAIDLLDQDGSTNHIAVLRQYLDNPDPRVQAKAARALAVDPQSRARIVALARNPGTAEEVRVNALRALAREDGQFASYAIPLVEDAQGSPGVRYAAMQDLAGRMNYSNVEPADQVRFAQAVEKLAGDSALTTESAVKIRQEAAQLHEYLRKTFPEVRKHYENP